jgi:beta-lactamase class A
MSKKTIFAFIIILFYLEANAQQTAVRLQEIASTLNARVGVSAMVLETGDTISFRAERKYPMQSVYKLPISMAVLAQVDRGKLFLQQMVKVKKSEIIPRGVSPIRIMYPKGTSLTLTELLRLNVAESDGTACDVLIRLMGGPAGVEAYLRSLGVADMHIATTEMVQISDDWIQYQNWCRPMATTVLLKKLYSDHVLSKTSTLMLLKWMMESVPGNLRLKGNLRNFRWTDPGDQRRWDHYLAQWKTSGNFSLCL